MWDLNDKGNTWGNVGQKGPKQKQEESLSTKINERSEYLTHFFIQESIVKV